MSQLIGESITTYMASMHESYQRHGCTTAAEGSHVSEA